MKKKVFALGLSGAIGANQTVLTLKKGRSSGFV